jgi:cytidylate kinase
VRDDRSPRSSRVATPVSRGFPGKHGQDRRFAQLVVKVDDHPGELARLLTEIGEVGVNMEDLRLEHSPGHRSASPRSPCCRRWRIDSCRARVARLEDRRGVPMTEKTIVAIDGPAGSGKSSVSKAAARRLGFDYQDTGAAYRALAWFALERGIDTADEAAVVDALAEFDYRSGIDPDDYFVRVGGVDVESAIREPRISSVVSAHRAGPEVRAYLVELFRHVIASESGKPGIITEGRDITTVVCARCAGADSAHGQPKKLEWRGAPPKSSGQSAHDVAGSTSVPGTPRIPGSSTS